MTKAERRVVEAARAALRWFDNHTRGNALNGPTDDLRIGRELAAALRAADAEQQAQSALKATA